MSEKFVCPEPSTAALGAADRALRLEAGYKAFAPDVTSALRAAYAIDLPRIVRKEVERAFIENQYWGTGVRAEYQLDDLQRHYLTRFEAAPEPNDIPLENPDFERRVGPKPPEVWVQCAAGGPAPTDGVQTFDQMPLCVFERGHLGRHSWEGSPCPHGANPPNLCVKCVPPSAGERDTNFPPKTGHSGFPTPEGERCHSICTADNCRCRLPRGHDGFHRGEKFYEVWGDVPTPSAGEEAIDLSDLDAIWRKLHGAMEEGAAIRWRYRVIVALLAEVRKLRATKLEGVVSVREEDDTAEAREAQRLDGAPFPPKAKWIVNNAREEVSAGETKTGITDPTPPLEGKERSVCAYGCTVIEGKQAIIPVRQCPYHNPYGDRPAVGKTKLPPDYNLVDLLEQEPAVGETKDEPICGEVGEWFHTATEDYYPRCTLPRGHVGQHRQNSGTPWGETKCQHDEVLMTAGGPCKRCGFLTSPETATTEQLERHRFAVRETQCWCGHTPEVCARTVCEGNPAVGARPEGLKGNPGIQPNQNQRDASRDWCGACHNSLLGAYVCTKSLGHTDPHWMVSREDIPSPCTACTCASCTALREFVKELAKAYESNNDAVVESLHAAARRVTG